MSSRLKIIVEAEIIKVKAEKDDLESENNEI